MHGKVDRIKGFYGAFPSLRPLYMRPFRSNTIGYLSQVLNTLGTR